LICHSQLRSALANISWPQLAQHVWS